MDEDGQDAGGVADEDIVNFLSEQLGESKELIKDFSQSEQINELYEILFKKSPSNESKSQPPPSKEKNDEKEKEKERVKEKERERKVKEKEREKDKEKEREKDKEKERVKEKEREKEKEKEREKDKEKERVKEKEKEREKDKEKEREKDKEREKEKEKEKIHIGSEIVGSNLKISRPAKLGTTRPEVIEIIDDDDKASGVDKENSNEDKNINTTSSGQSKRPSFEDALIGSDKVVEDGEKPSTSKAALEEEALKNNSTEKEKPKRRRPQDIVLDPDFAKYQKEFGLMPCSVIVCDLLEMGSHFKSLSSKDGNPASTYEKVKEKVYMPDERVKVLMQKEKLKREFFVKKIDQLINWEELKKSGITDGREENKERMKKENKRKNEERLRKKAEREAREEREAKESKKREEERKKKREEKEKRRKRMGESSNNEPTIKREKIDNSYLSYGEIGDNGVRVLPFERVKDESVEDKVRRDRLKYEAEKDKRIKREEKEKEEKNKKRMERIAADRKRAIANAYKIPKLIEQKMNEAKVSTTTPLATHNQGDRLKYNTFKKYERKAEVIGDWLKNDGKGKEREKKEMKIVNPPTPWDIADDDFDDDENKEVEEEVPEPLAEPKLGSLAAHTLKILQDKSITLASADDIYNNISEDNLSELCARKCAWWFLSVQKVPDFVSELACPEFDEESYSNLSCNDSEISFNLGNVSDIGEDGERDDCQINVITSTSYDPNRDDEYCGAALLSARLRKENDTFFDLFNLRPGSNYEKQSFQGQCNICLDLILGRQNLAAHVRSEKHKTNLLNLSINMAKPEEKEGRTLKIRSRSKPDPDNGLEDIIGVTSGGLSIKIPAECLGGNKDRIKRNASPRKRSRSRSPRSHHSKGSGHRSRDRKRRRTRSRSKSKERAERFIGKCDRKSRSSRSPASSLNYAPSYRSNASSSKSMPKLFDKDSFNLRLELIHSGAWGKSKRQISWETVEKEDEILRKSYEERSKSLAEKPEGHPNYGQEWTDFWEKKYQEVEDAGKDPDTYDYVSDWKEHWLQRVDFLLKEELTKKRNELKVKYQVNHESLLKLRNVVPPSPVISNPAPVRIVPPPPPKINTDISLPLPPGTEPQKTTVNFVPNPAFERSTSVKSAGSHPLIDTNPLISFLGENKPIELESAFSFGRREPESKRINDHFKAKSMSISDASSAGSKRSGHKIKVTVDDIKNTWQNITGQLIQNTPQVIPSITLQEQEDLDAEEFDVVQVLKLMTQNEDQLSFYAPRILEYFQMAEKLETEALNKSRGLLMDKEFVVLMFNCRDRFMNLIKGQGLPRPIVKKLNLTLYAMNEILETDICKKHRPAQISPEAPKDLPSQLQTGPLGGFMTSDPIRTRQQDGLKETLKMKINASKAEDIASEIAKTMMQIGRENATDTDLKSFLNKIFSTAIVENGFQVSRDDLNFTWSQSEATKKPIDSSKRDVYKDSAYDIVRKGTALPPLANFEARAASPPRVHMEPHLQLASSLRDQRRGRSPPHASGRSSPFSRRDFAGINPSEKRSY